MKTVSGRIIDFKAECLGSKDIYNPTAPFVDDNRSLMMARVESRNSEIDSEAHFFFRNDYGIWEHDPSLPFFPLQDPFITQIHGEWIIGGVRFPLPAGGWETWFYRGESLGKLEKFASGPIGMKGIRLVELPDCRIGVFTRPQGEIGGRGKIGFTIINTVDDLDSASLYDAPLIGGQFSDDNWGGVNEAQLLDDGLIGAVGHIAYFTERYGETIRDYRPTAFTYNYETGEASPLKELATRSDFPPGEVKRDPDLRDVVYSAGIIRHDNGKADLYVGLSDAQCGIIEIDDPFEGWK